MGSINVMYFIASNFFYESKKKGGKGKSTQGLGHLTV